MFQLTRDEVKMTRSQIVTLQKGGWGNYVFTELGVAMLSSVLKSKKAIQVNIQIIKTLARIRELLATNEALQRKMIEMERKYDGKIKEIFDTIGFLLEDKIKPKKKIGF